MKFPEITNEYLVKWTAYIFLAVVPAAIIQKIFDIPDLYAIIVQIGIILIILGDNIHGRFAKWYLFEWMVQKK